MSKKTNEIRRKIKEKEEKYKRKLTYKEVKRIEKDVLRKYNMRKKVAGIFLALGITTVGGVTAGHLLASGSNDVPENAKKTEATIENSENMDTSKKTNDFKENLQTLTYSQITEEIAKEYNEEYDTNLTASDISYIKSNPQYLTIDEDGTYVQDYRQSGENNEYIYDNIKDVYVFINKKDDTIISSIGKVENEVKNIDTNIVMLSGKQEYVESDKKIDITKGKYKEQLEEMYKAMQEKSKQKTQDDTQEKQVENEERE